MIDVLVVKGSGVAEKLEQARPVMLREAGVVADGVGVAEDTVKNITVIRMVAQCLHGLSGELGQAHRAGETHQQSDGVINFSNRRPHLFPSGQGKAGAGGSYPIKSFGVEDQTHGGYLSEESKDNFSLIPRFASTPSIGLPRQGSGRVGTSLSGQVINA